MGAGIHNIPIIRNCLIQLFYLTIQCIYLLHDQIIGVHHGFRIFPVSGDDHLRDSLLRIDDLLGRNLGNFLKIIQLILNLFKIFFQHEVGRFFRLENAVILLLAPQLLLLLHDENSVDHHIQTSQIHNRKDCNRDEQFRVINHRVQLCHQDQCKQKCSKNYLHPCF